MGRYFNVTGACDPKFHYMVDLKGRLQEIKQLIDRGAYFVMNRPRQYGKTTTLRALGHYLQEEYVIINMDFQMLSHSDFQEEASFVMAFARELLAGNGRIMPGRIKKELRDFSEGKQPEAGLALLFAGLSRYCAEAGKPVVLIIDEVDSASNNQVFLDFLAQLRGYYMQRNQRAIFQSVILAGVHDIRNIRQKIRKEEEHRLNSPWNIAADFLVDMSFSKEDIAGMLKEYEIDHNTGMDISGMAAFFYEYTSGYPYLVSRLCNIMDERLLYIGSFQGLGSIWTKSGFLEAVKILLSEKNSLFESLINKLGDYPELKNMLYEILFHGGEVVYTIGLESIENAEMFGFVRKEGANAVVANRIFETILYNWFLSAKEIQGNDLYKAALQDKNQFVEHGRLDMRLVLERFLAQFTELYGDCPQKFLEEEGRKYFLMFLRPIINGTGNYYIEAQTRTAMRSDVIVDYHGEQFLIELKIWRGQAYHEKGEQQLLEYLDFYHLKTGYLLTFNFNKRKEGGVKEVSFGDKSLVEAVV